MTAVDFALICAIPLAYVLGMRKRMENYETEISGLKSHVGFLNGVISKRKSPLGEL